MNSTWLIVSATCALMVLPGSFSASETTVQVLPPPGESGKVVIFNVDSRDIEKLAPKEIANQDLPALNLPGGRFVLIWVGASGEATAGLLEVPQGDRPIKFKFESPQKGRGVVVMRVAKSRSLDGIDLQAARISGANGRSVKPEAVVDDLVVFNGIPQHTDLNLAPPQGSCLATNEPFQLKGPWQTFRSEAIRCSQLVVRVAGFAPSPEAALFARLRRFESGEPGPSVRELHLSSKRDAVFTEIGPGTYILELEVPSLQYLQAENVTLSAESDAEIDAAIGFIQVRGNVEWRGAVATGGNVTFGARHENRKVAVVGTVSLAGDYEVNVPGAGPYVVSYHPSGDAEAAQERAAIAFYDVPTDADPVWLDLEFPDTLVSGQVIDDQGSPLKDATVEATVVRGGSYQTTQTSTDILGQYRFTDLVIGEVSLSGRKNGYRQESEYVFSLIDSPRIERNLVLTKIATVRVRIVGGTGSPVASRPVHCAPASLPVSWSVVGFTDQAGVVEIDPEIGMPLACSVSTAFGPMGSFLLSEAKDATWQLGSQDSTLIVIFRDEGGSPVPQQRVLIRTGGQLVAPDALAEQQATRSGNIMSQPNGSCVLAGLPIGHVEIYLAKSGNSLIAAAQGSDMDRVASLELQPNEAKTVQVVLEPEGSAP